jgi:hypothetical protein
VVNFADDLVGSRRGRGYDGLQDDTAVRTVCRTRTFVSGDRGERWLEFRCSGDAAMDAGGMTTAGRP